MDREKKRQAKKDHEEQKKSEHRKKMSVLATQIENDEDLVTTGAVGRELVKMLHEEDSDHKESSADEEEEFEKD